MNLSRLSSLLSKVSRFKNGSRKPAPAVTATTVGARPRNTGNEVATDPSTLIRLTMRCVLSAFFAAAGAAHLIAPDTLLAITPNWVPFPRQVIFLTGLFEIAAAVGLLTQSLRQPVGMALAIYALCVWPANFNHAFAGSRCPPFLRRGGITARGWHCSP